jgi:NADH-quinone oxidoreductase subunit J
LLEDFFKNIDYKLVQQIIFFVFGAATIGGALYLLFTKNVLYAAFSLLFTLLGISGLYVFAGADFLAVSQIMIYVGGILVLMIFGIMLTNNKSFQRNNAQANKIIVKHHNRFWAVLVAFLLFLGYLKIILEANFHILGQQMQKGSTVNQIGVNLMTDYVFAFEVIGILLLAALIGAVYIAKKEKA